MNKLSIDFGTSYSTASYLDAEGNPCPVCFGVSQYNTKCLKIPTVIQYAIAPNGEERKIIGESALFNLIQSNQEDSSIISKIKTELRERTGYIVNGKPKKSVDIVADIIGYIKSIAEKDAKRSFSNLILTHPAQYEAIKKRLLEEAALKSGFTGITLLEEPKAAAYAFIAKHNIPDGKGAIVFDYGGGTIDIAYLWIESTKNIQFKFQPVGKERCGGEYIDIALHNHFVKTFSKNSKHILPILLDQCNRLKLNFALKEEQDLMFDHKVATLSLSEFESIISPKVNIAIDLLSDVISQCDSQKAPIDYVFLNGGSSRLDMVSRSITKLLPDVDLFSYGEDDIAVSLGAQLYVKRSDSSDTMIDFKKGNVRGVDSALEKIIKLYKKSQV